MKRTAAALLVILLCLSGCRRNCVTVGSLEITQDHTIFMRYELLSGEKIYRVKLEENSTLSVETATKSGTLQIEIGMDGQEPVYSGNLSEDFDFTVNIREPGNYQIHLNGQDHSGSYRFSWE